MKHWLICSIRQIKIHQNAYIYQSTKLKYHHIFPIYTVQQFQKDLTSLSYWSDNNHLSFNTSKFVFMHFHNNSEYTIHRNVITHSSSCKDLRINTKLHYQATHVLLQNHLACYGIFLMIFIVLRQENIVCVCGNPAYCLTSN